MEYTGDDQSGLDYDFHCDAKRQKRDSEVGSGAEGVLQCPRLPADCSETLENLKNLCESVMDFQGEATSTTAVVAAASASPGIEKTGDKKADVKFVKKKRKKKAESGKESKEKAGSKSHMRKNIRDILKDEELELETREAQQRELERVQRLQQLQQHQRQIIENSSYNQQTLPMFDESCDADNPAAALVEDLQALAKELEEGSLSPDIPIWDDCEAQTAGETSPHMDHIFKV